MISSRVIKAQDRVQDGIIDIRVQDQDQANTVSRPPTLLQWPFFQLDNVNTLF